MTNFSVLILGSSSATPTATRHPSAQAINIHDRIFLVDCGEWTQMQLKRYRIRYNRINHVFISHLHGDHYLGLPGLVFSMHLFGRKSALHIYGNPELENILSLQLKVSETTLLFPLIFHPLEPEKAMKVFEDEAVEVTAFPLLHRIPTHGFVFREKAGRRKILPEAVTSYKIPAEACEKLKNGDDLVLPDGTVIPNAKVTAAPDPPRSYAYCSDTGYTEQFLDHIRGVDLLYHEATFMKDKEVNAREKMHSTTVDAAAIAKAAGVKRLLIGHYSARYDELQPMLDETCAVFPGSYLTRDGMVFNIE